MSTATTSSTRQVERHYSGTEGLWDVFVHELRIKFRVDVPEILTRSEQAVIYYRIGVRGGTATTEQQLAAINLLKLWYACQCARCPLSSDRIRYALQFDDCLDRLDASQNTETRTVVDRLTKQLRNPTCGGETLASLRALATKLQKPQGGWKRTSAFRYERGFFDIPEEVTKRYTGSIPQGMPGFGTSSVTRLAQQVPSSELIASLVPDFNIERTYASLRRVAQSKVVESTARQADSLGGETGACKPKSKQGARKQR